MKTILKTVPFLVIFAFLGSCTLVKPVSVTNPASNPGYRVEYLFEHDGCKVYRFLDYGHYVYFTNCQGDVTSVENDSIQFRTIQVKKNPLPK